MKSKYIVASFVAGVLMTLTITAGANTIYEKYTAVARPDFTLVIDGEKVALNTPPKTIEGATHLPLREMATILDKDVNFKSGTITLTTKKESEGDTVIESNKPKVNEISAIIGEEFYLGNVKLKVNSITYSQLAAYEPGGKAGFVPSSGEKFVLINFDVLAPDEPSNRFTWSASDFVSHIEVNGKTLHGTQTTGESMKIIPNEEKTVEVFMSLPETMEVSTVYFRNPHDFFVVGKLNLNQ